MNAPHDIAGMSRAGANAPAPLVAMRGISKTFANGTIALNGLDLDVSEGAFLALLGPSGCGKSTALRIMAGLARANSGTVNWSKDEESDTPSGNIGFVFQEPTLMPWTSVAQNVYLPLKLAGISRANAADRIAECLALVGLSGFADAYPRELSGGMKMRVSIARALALKPRLLLMDEPFAALDEITRFKLNDDLLRLKAETGCTIVFVTHSVYESVYLASEIAVMAARPGRIVARITVDDPSLLDKPLRDESFRSSQLYAELTRKTSAALHGAMAPNDHL
jgi:NitT/TauT family transport system ATP-binding protein